ncbi:MAG: YbaK/EbsC family protein [Actinomycetota bacterium]|nr:YbaK/EbsC family protein [Actinomycetota bacterium]
MLRTMRERVVSRASRIGLEVRVRTLDAPTRTVAEAAAAVGCHARQIAKSIVFIADGDPVVCIASGNHRVDLDRLAEILDVAEVRQATAQEVCAATGFPVGGVAPLGHDLPLVFDAALLEERRVFAAGGDGNTLVEVEPRALAERTRARVVSLDAAKSPGAAA